jgi:hypothetical protein
MLTITKDRPVEDNWYSIHVVVDRIEGNEFEFDIAASIMASQPDVSNNQSLSNHIQTDPQKYHSDLPVLDFLMFSTSRSMVFFP